MKFAKGFLFAVLLMAAYLFGILRGAKVVLKIKRSVDISNSHKDLLEIFNQSIANLSHLTNQPNR